MNFRFIEAFVWVARLYSFKAAADKLHITQAAISSRIAALENQLGMRLFERDERNVALTYSGSELLKHAEQLLVASARMMDAVSDRSSFRGRVAIGVIEALVYTWLPDLLRRFHAIYPHASVEIHSDHSPRLHDDLRKGGIDLAFTVRELSDRGVENVRLCSYSMGWIASPSLGLSNRPLDTDIFEHYPVITFLSDSFVYTDQLSKLRGLNSIVVNHFSSIAAMVSLVKGGYGIATLPIAAIHDDIASGEIVPLNIQPALAAQPLVANLRAATDSPLAEPLVQLAREVVVQFVERYPARGICLES